MSTIYATLMGGEHDQHAPPVAISDSCTAGDILIELLNWVKDKNHNKTQQFIYILGFSPTTLSIPLTQGHLISTR